MALDAAALGRLSRLQEKIVETLARDLTLDEDGWQVKRSVQTQLLKSSFQRCIQEAAAAGLVKRLLDAVEVSKEEQPIENNSGIDDTDPPNTGDRRPLLERQVSDAVRRNRQAKVRTFKSNAAVLQSIEDEEELRQAWESPRKSHSLTVQTTTLSPTLPSPVVPCWRKRLCGMSLEKMRECLAYQAADQAYERLWRLQSQPTKQLLLRDGCSCIYCSKRPSAYQTLEYQRLAKDPTYNETLRTIDLDKKDYLENTKDGASNSERISQDQTSTKMCLPSTTSTDIPSPAAPGIKEVAALKQIVNTSEEIVNTSEDESSLESYTEALPSSEIPLLSTIYHRGSLSDEKIPFDPQQVAAKACDRAFKLLTNEQDYAVKTKCSCPYCPTASPQQTRRYKQLYEAAKVGPRRSSTAPTPSSKTTLSFTTRPKRWTSIPTPASLKMKEANSSSLCRDSYVASTLNAGTPSWVSPLVSRQKMNYLSSDTSNGNDHRLPLLDSLEQTSTPPSIKSVVQQVSPDDVAAFVDPPLMVSKGKILSIRVPSSKSAKLDDDVDEEQLLWDQLTVQLW